MNILYGKVKIVIYTPDGLFKNETLLMSKEYSVPAPSSATINYFDASSRYLIDV